MITIVYSTHKDGSFNSKFRKQLEKTVGLDNIQILEYQNNNEYSLAQIYNKGISEAKYDIIVCCHNDVHFSNKWGVNLLNDFNENQDFAIIGKAGSWFFPRSGIYWEEMARTMVGQVYHHPKGKIAWLSEYSEKQDKLIPVVTIDGLFIAFDKTKIKHTFDETIGRFHFYDHLFCVPNFLDGVKIGVTSSFDITHESIGKPNDDFFITKNHFVEKYINILPIDIKNFNYGK